MSKSMFSWSPLVIILTLGILVHDSGTPFAEWMMSLKRPDNPMSSCCGAADQYWVKDYIPSEQQDMAFSATVLRRDGKSELMVEVPRAVVVWDRVNPTGRGVIFIQFLESEIKVLCFVPGPDVPQCIFSLSGQGFDVP